jgi:ABC-2 type transport system permease protein
MSTPAESARTGVIHDLGYRHYTGPRQSRRAVRGALFAESAKGAYGLGRSARSKVMPMLLLAAISVPTLIIAVVASITKLKDLPVDYTTYILNVQFLVMVYVAGQAPASVSRDLRFRVMSLYFSRPLTRLDYVTAKYAALSAALFLFMAIPLTILFVGALLAKIPLRHEAPDYLRSLVGAVLMALVLAGIGLVIASITPRRGLGIAAIIAVLAVSAGVEGAVGAIADEQGAKATAGYAGLFSPFTLVHGVQSSVLGAKNVLPEGPPGAVGGLVFVGVTVVVIAACLGALGLRYRKVSI